MANILKTETKLLTRDMFDDDVVNRYATEAIAANSTTQDKTQKYAAIRASQLLG